VPYLVRVGNHTYRTGTGGRCGEQMPRARGRLCGAIFVILLLGGASGCSAGLSIGPVAAAKPQRPGTCRIAPPQVHFPIGEWTATETVLTTEAIDGCVGERLVRPFDFRRLCKAGKCKTYLFSASYYSVEVAQIVPHGRDRYVAVFQPTTVPCPHRPGEDTGTNRSYLTLTLWWSSDRQILRGLSREHQVGPCGGGPIETSSYVVRRTDPSANPPAEGP
jgi:hypothetical protein